MQEVIIGLVCDNVIKKIQHMSKLINKIAKGLTLTIILIIINVIFLFGGQTIPSSRLVQIEISCEVPTSMNPREW